MPKALGLMEQFISKVLVLKSGCWEWIGGIDGTGYGQLGVKGVLRPAHRVSYELFIGPIPDGLQLDHTCHNPALCPRGIVCLHRRCVNPEHLEPVTRKENLRRGHKVSGLYQRAKTHCPHGHEYSVENTRHRLNGQRVCRACARNYYYKQKRQKEREIVCLKHWA